MSKYFDISNPRCIFVLSNSIIMNTFNIKYWLCDSNGNEKIDTMILNTSADASNLHKSFWDVIDAIYPMGYAVELLAYTQQ